MKVPSDAASWALVGAVMAGLALRLWGLDFGLPHTAVRPDESILVHRALAVAGGQWNPGFFNYPSLHIYLLSVTFGLLYASSWLLGAVPGPQEFLLGFLQDPTQVYLAGRMLTVSMGTATIVCTWHLATKLGGRTSGAISVVLLAAASLHVRDSHFLTVDVPVTFWATASLAALVYHARHGGRRALIIGSALLGLAVSTKYNAALFTPALIMAVVLAPRKDRRSDLLLAAGVATGAFFCGSPFIALDPAAFWRDWHTVASRAISCCWPRWPAISPSQEAAAACSSDTPSRWSLCCVSRLAQGSDNCCIAAQPGQLCWHWLVLASPSALTAVEQVRLLATDDTRELARNWLEANVPSGARIALTGSSYGHPRLHPTKAWLQRRLEQVRREGQPGRRLQLALESSQYPPTPAYDLVELPVAPTLHELQRDGIDWLVVQTHPLAYARVPPLLQAQLQDRTAEAVFMPGTDTSLQAATFDPLDAWYLPMAGQADLLRPGPSI